MAERVRYFGVKNLDKHQHYKDRRPPWVKLHRTVFNDYAFSRLQGASKAHLMLLWLLASEYDNRMPYDPEWVGRKIDAQEPVDLDALVSAGFLTLYQDASDTLAECAKTVSPENREQRTEDREEKVVGDGDAGASRFAVKLAVAMNAGIAENGKWPAPVTPINGSSGASLEAAEAVIAAGVEEEFACRSFFTVGKRATSDRPPTSLKYGVRATVDAWQREQTRKAGDGLPPPVELPAAPRGFSSAGELAAQMAGIEQWKRQQRAKESA